MAPLLSYALIRCYFGPIDFGPYQCIEHARNWRNCEQRQLIVLCTDTTLFRPDRHGRGPNNSENKPKRSAVVTLGRLVWTPANSSSQFRGGNSNLYVILIGIDLYAVSNGEQLCGLVHGRGPNNSANKPKRSAVVTLGRLVWTPAHSILKIPRRLAVPNLPCDSMW